MESNTSSRQFSPPSYCLWLVLLFIVWLGLVYESLATVVKVWSDSTTYNHGFFVLPISAYLIWQERHKVLLRTPEFQPLLLVLIVPLLFLWLFAFAGKIDVLTHIASFSLLPLFMLMALGRQIGRIIWFPLLFSLFSIPVGEELIPLFQEITADISVKMLLWSGVPVFREGLFIQIPEGKFLVAEACSGIRFFISTVMLGTLCAYLLFRSNVKRISFLCFAVILPIIANAIRAFGIMMVGYYSGMRYAMGADHLIYGWLFFAIVTILLISVGYYFRDNDFKDGDARQTSSEGGSGISVHSGWNAWPDNKQIILIIALGVIFLSWKYSINNLESTAVKTNLEYFDKFFAADKLSDSWTSYFPEATKSVKRTVSVGEERIDLQFWVYSGVSKSAELISWKNRIFDPEKWTLRSQKNIPAASNRPSYELLEIVSSYSESRSVIYWYDVPGYEGASRIKTKLRQSLNIMLGGGSEGALFVVSVKGENFERNAEILADWVAQNHRFLQEVTPW